MRRGFTLVEVLVVVGLIILLIAIALPVLSNARKRSQQINCGVYLKQIMQATTTYADMNNFFLPFPNSDSLESNPSAEKYWPGPGWLYHWQKVQERGRDRDSFKPSDRETGLLWDFLREARVYYCPSAPRPGNRGNSSVMSSYMMNAAARGLALSNIANRVVPSIRLDRFQGSAVVFWEAMGADESNTTGRPYSPNWNDGCVEPRNGPTLRHLNGVNVACFDNHCELWDISTFVKEEDTEKFSRLWCDPRFPDTGRTN